MVNRSFLILACGSLLLGVSMGMFRGGERPDYDYAQLPSPGQDAELMRGRKEGWEETKAAEEKKLGEQAELLAKVDEAIDLLIPVNAELNKENAYSLTRDEKTSYLNAVKKIQKQYPVEVTQALSDARRSTLPTMLEGNMEYILAKVTAALVNVLSARKTGVESRMTELNAHIAQCDEELLKSTPSDPGFATQDWNEGATW